MRLIDADDLREKHCEDCNADVQASCKDDPVCASLMWVVEQPTVDAVPVVRCKDCKHYQIENQHDNEYRCCKDKYMANHDGDWFCADGERK